MSTLICLTTYNVYRCSYATRYFEHPEQVSAWLKKHSGYSWLRFVSVSIVK